MCIRHAGILSSIFVNYKDSEFDDVHTLETLSYMQIIMESANAGVAGNYSPHPIIPNILSNTEQKTTFAVP